jgi:hypothetical protein
LADHAVIRGVDQDFVRRRANFTTFRFGVPFFDWTPDQNPTFARLLITKATLIEGSLWSKLLLTKSAFDF